MRDEERQTPVKNALLKLHRLAEKAHEANVEMQDVLYRTVNLMGMRDKRIGDVLAKAAYEENTTTVSALNIQFRCQQLLNELDSINQEEIDNDE